MINERSYTDDALHRGRKGRRTRICATAPHSLRTVAVLSSRLPPWSTASQPFRCPEGAPSEQERQMRIKFTDNSIARLPPAKPGQRKDYIDALVPNLIVRATHTSRTFMFRMRLPSTRSTTRRSLGKVGAMSIDAARTKAQAWHALLDKHIDPAWQAEQDRLAA